MKVTVERYGEDAFGNVRAVGSVEIEASLVERMERSSSRHDGESLVAVVSSDTGMWMTDEAGRRAIEAAKGST